MFIWDSFTQKYIYTWYELNLGLGGVGVRHCLVLKAGQIQCVCYFTLVWTKLCECEVS
jgi:hypothetical protein